MTNNPSMVSGELKPCPFCKSTDASFGLGENPDGSPTYSPSCMNCGASGPDRPTVEEAIAAWNTRADDGDAVYQVFSHDNFTPDSWVDCTKEEFERYVKKFYEVRILYTHPMRELTDFEVWAMYQTIHTAYEKCDGSDFTQLVGNVFREWLKGRK